MATKTVQKTEITPRALQKSFVLAVFVVYVLQAVPTLYAMAAQYPNNSNLSAYYMSALYGVIVPIVLVAAAWLVSPRKISRLGKAFESTLLALLGFFVTIVAGMAASYWPVDYSAPATYPWVSVVMPLVAAVLYVGLLAWLRKSDRWK